MCCNSTSRTAWATSSPMMDVLEMLEAENRIVFRYVNSDGVETQESNPNGAMHNIAGIINEDGNVMGLMPHPERSVETILGLRGRSWPVRISGRDQTTAGGRCHDFRNRRRRRKPGSGGPGKSRRSWSPSTALSEEEYQRILSVLGREPHLHRAGCFQCAVVGALRLQELEATAQDAANPRALGACKVPAKTLA